MEEEKFSDGPPLFHTYTKEVNRLQPSDRNVVGILYSCVKAIVISIPKPETPESDDIPNGIPANDEFYDNKGHFVRLSDISSRDTMKALLHSMDNLSRVVSMSPYTIDMNDSVRRHRMKKLLLPATAKPPTSKVSYLEDLTQFEMAARIRLQLYRLISEDGIPLRPQMSEVEQGIKESELFTFTSLAPTDFYRSNQLQEFADIIRQETKALSNFTGALKMGDGEDGSIIRRKYFRFCSALLFAQLLSDEHVTEPMIMKRYYPMTDNLLYCLHWAPPDRRNKRNIWTKTLGWGQSTTDNSNSKTVSMETVTLTPAGKMIVMIKQHSSDVANPYLTAHLHGTMMGVRLVPLHSIHHSLGSDEDDELPEQESVMLAQEHEASVEGETDLNTGVSRTGELSASNLKLLNCGFFFHSVDDVRYSVFDGPTHDPVVKPDKFGTVCMSARFPQRLQVTVCSEGSIQIVSDKSILKEDKVVPTESEYPLFYEKSRFIGEKGTIHRRFDGKRHPIVAEYLLMDGSRELHLSSELLQVFRNRSPRTTAAHAAMDDIFEFSILKLIPLETKIIQLSATGEVNCYCLLEQEQSHNLNPSSHLFDESKENTKLNFPSENRNDQLHHQQHHQKYEKMRVDISNICSTKIDAESKSVVHYFRDGRLITVYPDASTRIHFPDRTVIQYHPKNKLLYISRFRAWPTVEIDVEVDSMCRGHAQGLEVPINKGGERVRSRIALPDGSIIMIKYDTRVTTTSNGSIRLVCRDRTEIYVQDDGKLTFRPFTTWNQEAQRSFDKDLMIEDVVPEAVSHSGFTMAHFTPLADNPMMQDTSLNGGSSTTTLPTETSSKFKEDASRVSYQIKQTAPALKNKTNKRQKSSMQTLQTIPSGTSLASSKYEENQVDDSNPNNKPKAPEDMDHHELFTSSAEADAVITVQLRKAHVHILDYEYNAFDIDLSVGRKEVLLRHQEKLGGTTGNEGAASSLEKKSRSSSGKKRTSQEIHEQNHNSVNDHHAGFTYTVRLAGEVEGCKPPAVARIPKSPRCFIVNRFGEATEVLSLQDVSAWECYFKNISDAFRSEESVSLTPAELGPCRILRYFLPKKLITSYLDGFKFDEIVGKRQYCSANLPAAAQYFLHEQKSTSHYVHEDDWLALNMPRIFETLSLIERHPLSNEGYSRIIQAIQKCEEFRQERVKNIDRFAIEDPRTAEQIEEEEAMVKRLKQLYKAAKANAAKKKDHRLNSMKIEEGEEGEEEEEEGGGGGSVMDPRRKGGAPSVTSSPSKVNSARSAGMQRKGAPQHTILEGQNEDGDGDDNEGGDENDEPDFGSDDGEKEPDPIDVLLKSTFEDFLSEANAHSSNYYGNELLPTSCLQEAFVLIFNRFISTDLIEQAAYDCGEVDPGLEELTLNEFRAVYFSLNRILNGSHVGSMGDNNSSMLDDNQFSRSHDMTNDMYDDDGHEQFPDNNENNPPTSRFMTSAPPLNLNKLHSLNSNNNSTGNTPKSRDGGVARWDDAGSVDMDSTTFNEASPKNGVFAAGSGLRMVRNVKSANP